MFVMYYRLDSTPTTILIVVYSLIIILGFLSNMGIGIALATDQVRQADSNKDPKPNLKISQDFSY